jgi:hypothetical protein
MNVLEIIKLYLESNGFDGLTNDECGCGLDDLVPCESDCSMCCPAYKSIVNGEEVYCRKDEKI